jgi:hypothetical protein
MSERDDKGRSDFDRALRAWGRRAPRTPPETAARRVVRLVTEPGAPRRRPRLGWVAATIFVAAAGTWLVVRNGGDLPKVPPPATAADFTAPPLDDNVVLWWLDEETPVYFVLQSPQDEENEDDDPKAR